MIESDPQTARQLAEESLAITRDLNDLPGMAHVLYHLGRLARQRGEDDAAETYWRECHAIDRAQGSRGGHVMMALGNMEMEHGQLTEARRYFESFLTERHEMRDRGCVAWVLQRLSALGLAEGRPEWATRLLGAALAVRESMPQPLTPEERATCEDLSEALRAECGDRIYNDAMVAGRAFTLEQAVEFATTAG